MRKACISLLFIFLSSLSLAQEKNHSRIPISFNIGWTYHYHIQQIYPKDVDHFIPGTQIKQMDVDSIIAYHTIPDIAKGYKLIKPTDNSDFDMIEYAELKHGIKAEVDCQPYKIFNTGIGFEYSPNARDRYSYYLKLGVSLSTKKKNFFYSPHARIGGQIYQWNDFHQQHFFAGLGIDLDIRVIKDFLLNISFSGDWFQNIENWRFIRYVDERPYYYYRYTESRNDNWIITGSLGIKYKLMGK